MHACILAVEVADLEARTERLSLVEWSPPLATTPCSAACHALAFRIQPRTAFGLLCSLGAVDNVGWIGFRCEVAD